MRAAQDLATRQREEHERRRYEAFERERREAQRLANLERDRRASEAAYAIARAREAEQAERRAVRAEVERLRAERKAAWQALVAEVEREATEGADEDTREAVDDRTAERLLFVVGEFAAVQALGRSWPSGYCREWSELEP